MTVLILLYELLVIILKFGMFINIEYIYTLAWGGVQSPSDAVALVEPPECHPIAWAFSFLDKQCVEDWIHVPLPTNLLWIEALFTPAIIR